VVHPVKNKLLTNPHNRRRVVVNRGLLSKGKGRARDKVGKWVVAEDEGGVAEGAVEDFLHAIGECRPVVAVGEIGIEAANIIAHPDRARAQAMHQAMITIETGIEIGRNSDIQIYHPSSVH
jgi:hypothetical protein